MTDSSTLPPAEPERGLSSFANLLMVILGMDETAVDFNYAQYLACLGFTPGSTLKPTHPFFFPTDFPEGGPMEVLPEDVAIRMRESFAILRDVRTRLDRFSDRGDVPSELFDELGPQAMSAVRALGAALGYRRWDSGETMVKMFQLNRVLPSTAIGGASLVQAMNELGSDCYVWEDSEESDNKVRVMALRLVFQLPPADATEDSTPATLERLKSLSDEIAAVHGVLFPNDHCIVEFRDQTSATVRRSAPIGPSYAEVMAARKTKRST